MSGIDQKNDSKLLGQVLAFVGLLAFSMAENGLGYFPSLYGSVPKLSFTMLFVLCFYHPAIMPLISVFLVGVMHDLSQANPIGYTSALMVMAHCWIMFRRPMLMQTESGSIWYEFTIMMLAMMLFMLTVIVAFTGNLPALQPLLFQFSLTVLMFPMMNWMYHLIMGFAAMLEQVR